MKATDQIFFLSIAETLSQLPPTNRLGVFKMRVIPPIQKAKFVIINLFVFVFIVVQGPTAVGASNQFQNEKLMYAPGPEIIILADDYKGHFYVPPPQNLNSPAAVTINVDYVGSWDANAQTAFQAAIDVWAGLLTLPPSAITSLDVQANWTPLGDGILGSAGANAYWSLDFGGGNVIFYPDALADALLGVDYYTVYDPTEPTNTYEIIANFNSNYANWYTGTDGSPGPGEYDLMTVVLHELGHGVGFAGSASYSSGAGSLYDPPFVFDCFTADGANVSLLTYANPSTALGTAFTGNNIHFGGPNAVAAGGGYNAKLYAPATWSSGSSYSHLDDATYDGTPHALMTHALGAGEAVHDPGLITMGILTDTGWNGGAIPPVGGCPSIPTAITLQSFDAANSVSGPEIIFISSFVLVLIFGVQFMSRRKTSL
jgi:hypothetical protein